MFDVQHGWDEGNHRSLRIFHWPDWYFSVSPFQGRFGVLAVRCQILTTMSDGPSWAVLVLSEPRDLLVSVFAKGKKSTIPHWRGWNGVSPIGSPWRRDTGPADRHRETTQHTHQPVLTSWRRRSPTPGSPVKRIDRNKERKRVQKKWLVTF